MAQWVVESTDVSSGKDSESDWKEHASESKKDDALKKARELRKTLLPKYRVRVSIDYARGGMTG